MASVNKAIIVGNLGADPDMRYLPSGDAVCNLSIATTDKWKDKDGNKQEQTEWHRVAFFGRLAEVCGEYLKKGSAVYVEGSLRTSKYQKDGQDHWSTQIRGERMQMLGGGSGGERSESTASQNRAPSASRPAGGGAGNSSGSFADFDDDIPF